MVEIFLSALALNIGESIRVLIFDLSSYYIIDTTKLDASKGQKAFYMTDIVLKNQLKTWDESDGEVNCTEIPTKAIVGWIKFDTELHRDDPDLFKFLVKNNFHCKPEFNSKYKP